MLRIVLFRSANCRAVRGFDHREIVRAGIHPVTKERQAFAVLHIGSEIARERDAPLTRARRAPVDRDGKRADDMPRTEEPHEEVLVDRMEPTEELAVTRFMPAHCVDVPGSETGIRQLGSIPQENLRDLGSLPGAVHQPTESLPVQHW